MKWREVVVAYFEVSHVSCHYSDISRFVAHYIGRHSGQVGDLLTLQRRCVCLNVKKGGKVIPVLN
jgi:hypothetical protein